MQASSHSTF